MEVGKDRKLRQSGTVGLARELPAKDGLARLQETVEGAAAPAFSRLAFIAPAIFGQPGFLALGLPAEYAAFQGRVQRVDEDERTGDRQTKAASSLAETGNHRGFLPARQAGAGDPGRELGMLRLIHGAACPKRDRWSKYCRNSSRSVVMSSFS